MIISKKVRKCANYALAILAVGIVVFSAVNLVQGVQPFYTVSDTPSSMSPTINYGDAVPVYKVPFSDLKVGDIIVFDEPQGNRVVVHRIVAIETSENNSRYLVTKGDNNQTNPLTDPWKVTEQDYRAKVLAVAPFIGYLSPALWGSNAFLVIIPIVFAIALYYIFSNEKPKKNENEESTIEEKDKGGSKS
jgi:signal peptidase I